MKMLFSQTEITTACVTNFLPATGVTTDSGTLTKLFPTTGNRDLI